MTDKSFIQEYKKIIEPVFEDLKNLDNYFEDNFLIECTKVNPIIPIIKEFLSVKGKRIRSALAFLSIRAMGGEVCDFHYKLALANELIHDATLIHDDIIDCSLMRRGRSTLNFDYDSKLAVLAGDFLLAKVLKLLADIENNEIRKLYSNNILKIINGELNQYFNRFKILSIDEYVEKSKNKTARLFESGIVSSVIYNGESTEKIENMRNFALNFGTAFQIHNDIKIFDTPEKAYEDIENGDYTAPLIYWAKEKFGDNVININNLKQAVKQVKNSVYTEKAQELTNYYIKSAIENISFLEDNQYTRAIINLCNLYINK